MSPELADYLSKRASDAFRGLARYESDDVEVLHTRADLGRADMYDRAQAIHRAVQSRDGESVLDELGAAYATVQMREDAVILHFPMGDGRGYLVGLEPQIARDLSSFISDCIRIIQYENRQAGS